MWKKVISLAAAMAIVAGCLAGCGGSGSAGGTAGQSKAQPSADTFPKKEVTMVIPFGDSSGTNTIWRAFGASLEKELGVKVLYENQAGAGGSVGTTYFLNQPHDGYTILASSDATSLFRANQLIDVDYDDLTPLILVSANCGILVTYPDSKLDNMDFNQVVDYMKAHPKEITVGTVGIGSMPWVWWTLFEQVYGVELTIVNYDSGGDANTQLIGKHIDLFINGYTSGKPLIDAGSIKAIATMDLERLEGLPDVPALSELTHDFDSYMPNGSYFVAEVAADTPADVVDKLSDACTKAYESADFQRFIKANSGKMLGITGDAANEYMKHQQAVNSWLLYDSGNSTVSPDSYGVPRPN